MALYLRDAYRRLTSRLKELDTPLIAFSGGTDSTLVLHAARDACGKNVAAVTATAPYIPLSDTRHASEQACSWGVDYHQIALPFTSELRDNPPDRCYRCKWEMCSRMGALAREHGHGAVVDGTNADDLRAHRPGLCALREYGVHSPLAEEGITGEMVRAILASRGIPVPFGLSGSCLLTRMPYGTHVSDGLLERIERAEAYLHARGLSVVRVRTEGDTARVEIAREEMRAALDLPFLADINGTLTSLGWRHVALDAAGYAPSEDGQERV